MGPNLTHEELEIESLLTQNHQLEEKYKEALNIINLQKLKIEVLEEKLRK